MALQSSGKIRASQIRAEFGASGPSVIGKNYPEGSVSFGAYRDVSESHGGRTFTLDYDYNNNQPNIPRRGATGSIKFSDFYNAKLNVVCAYGTPTGTGRGNIVLNKYNNNEGIFVIGNFKNKPNSTASDFKFVIYVHGILPSKRGNRNYCALRTGKFNSELEVNLIVGSGARIYGAGGDGGHGGRWVSEDPPGDPGKNGTSAIGVQTNINVLRVEDGALVVAGGGGGGGGGGAKYIEENQTAGGGGGGGGAGLPPGRGGAAGEANPGDPDGTSGTDGSLFDPLQAGNGGNGGAHGSGNACGGGGGAGGSYFNDKRGSGGIGGEEETTVGTRKGGDGTQGSGGAGGDGGKGAAEGPDQNGQTGAEGGYAIIVESGSSVSSTITNSLVYGPITFGGAVE